MSTVEDDEQDLTRKQRREQARTQRRELEQAEAASAIRRTRLIQLGIVVGIVVAIIVAVVLATGGGSKKVPATGPVARKISAEVTALIGGIPQNGNTLGNPSAPVTLLERSLPSPARECSCRVRGWCSSTLRGRVRPMRPPFFSWRLARTATQPLRSTKPLYSLRPANPTTRNETRGPLPE